MKKFFFNFFLIGIIVAFSRFFNFAAINGVLPDLILIFLLLNGIFYDSLYALTFGFFAGLAMDVFEFYPILGFYAFIYTMLGYVTGFTKIFSIDNAFVFSIFLIIFTILKAAIFILLAFFTLDYGYIINYFKNIFFLELAYTLLISIPIFLVFKKIATRDKKAKVYE